MRKSKRPAALLLVLVLLISIGGAAQGTGVKVCFTSINDTLLVLSADTMPAFADGKLYAPVSSFSSTELGIFSSNNSEKKLLSMYRGDEIISFYLDKNYCSYDGIVDYGSCAITRNGRYYVPVGLVCSYFGLSWSYTEGLEYGDLLRICDTNVVFDDASFIEAAGSLDFFKLRYDNYTKTGESTELPTPVEQQTPEEPGVDPQDIIVRIVVDGITEDTAKLLELMANYGIKAAFFVTGQQVREHAALVRRICGEGHSIGVLLNGDEPEDIAELIFAAARQRPLLVRGAGERAEELAAAGWIVWDGAVTVDSDGARAALDAAESGTVLNFALDMTHESDPNYIIRLTGENDYGVASVTETSTPPEYRKGEENE